MKNEKIYLTLLMILVCSISLYADGNYLNTPRNIRIGLDIVGKPEISYITSSNDVIHISDLKTNKVLFSGKSSKLTITAKAAGNIQLLINNQTILTNNTVRISNKNPRSATLTLTPSAKKPKTYRGTLEVKSVGQRLNWINIVDIEDYLKSVVPSEISTRAPSSAIEAQAIAARTYAIRNIDRHLKKETYNLCDTVHCQAYFGISKEADNCNKAIKDTEGKILVFNETPANTVYHSNCGGYIISSKTAWGGLEVPYLIGHYDGIKGKKSFCEYGKSFLSKQTNLVLPEKSKRLVIGVTANNSKKKIHNNYGHRVGMCQDGAIGMALIGYSCSNILGFYYPKTKIETLKYAAKNKSNKFAPTVVTSLAELKDNSAKKKEKGTNKVIENKKIEKADNKEKSMTIKQTNSDSKKEEKTNIKLPASKELDLVSVKKDNSLSSIDSSKTLNSKEDKTTKENKEIKPNKQENDEQNKKDNKIKSILKEISTTKPNNAFRAARKIFWSPANPKVSKEMNKSRRK